MVKKKKNIIIIVGVCFLLWIVFILVVLYFANEYNRFHFDIGYEMNFNSKKIASITSVELYLGIDMTAKTDSDFANISLSGSLKSVPKERLEIFNCQTLKKYTKRTFDYDIAFVVDGTPQILINSDKNYGFVSLNTEGIIYTFYFELSEDIKQMISSLK